MLSLAQALEDPSRIVDARVDLGIALEFLGAWEASRDHLERTLSVVDHRPDPAIRLGAIPHVDLTPRRHLAIVLWHLGYGDQARVRIDEALALVEALPYPHTSALVLLWSALLHRLRGETPLVRAQAGKVVALARQHSFTYPGALGAILEGWAVARETGLAAGLAEMQEGLAVLRDMGAQLHVPECLSMLAEVHGWAGQPARGLAAVEEALALVELNGVRFAQAELHRQRGDLLWMQNANAAEAEACYLDALAVARRQGAKALELRAATSLARLQQGQVRQGSADRLLADIHGWFTEGLDTPDLQEARARLEQLLP